VFPVQGKPKLNFNQPRQVQGTGGTIRYPDGTEIVFPGKPKPTIEGPRRIATARDGLVSSRENPANFLRHHHGADSPAAEAYEMAVRELGINNVEGIAGSYATGGPRTQAWPDGTSFEQAAIIDKISASMPDSVVSQLPENVQEAIHIKRQMGPKGWPSDLDIPVHVNDAERLLALREKIYNETGVLVEFVDVGKRADINIAPVRVGGSKPPPGGGSKPPPDGGRGSTIKEISDEAMQRTAAQNLEDSIKGGKSYVPLAEVPYYRGDKAPIGKRIEIGHVVDDHYARKGLGPVPSTHTTDRAALDKIYKTKTLEGTKDSSASWSKSGTLRGGDIVIRLSERGKQHVILKEVTAVNKGDGMRPLYYAEGIGPNGQGIGKGVPDVPAEMLEYFNYRHDTWVPLVRN